MLALDQASRFFVLGKCNKVIKEQAGRLMQTKAF